MIQLASFPVLLAASVIFLPYIQGRFTQTTCSGGACVQQNAVGAWCYVPVSAATRATTCIGSSADLENVLETHLLQGLSVAYYNGVGDTLAGGANWSVPDNPGVVRLCLSGQSGDGNFQTECANVAEDNVMSGSPSCQVIRVQKTVTDGCYNPNIGLAHPPPTSVLSVTETLRTTATVTIYRLGSGTSQEHPFKFGTLSIFFYVLFSTF